MIPSTHQLTVFIAGRRREGVGCPRQRGGRRGGWRGLDLAGESSQKKKEEIAFREEICQMFMFPQDSAKPFHRPKLKLRVRSEHVS